MGSYYLNILRFLVSNLLYHLNRMNHFKYLNFYTWLIIATVLYETLYYTRPTINYTCSVVMQWKSPYFYDVIVQFSWSILFHDNSRALWHRLNQWLELFHLCYCCHIFLKTQLMLFYLMNVLVTLLLDVQSFSKRTIIVLLDSDMVCFLATLATDPCRLAGRWTLSVNECDIIWKKKSLIGGRIFGFMEVLMYFQLFSVPPITWKRMYSIYWHAWQDHNAYNILYCLLNAVWMYFFPDARWDVSNVLA